MQPIQFQEADIEPEVFDRPLIRSNAYQQLKMAPIVRHNALMLGSHFGYSLLTSAAIAREGPI